MATILLAEDSYYFRAAVALYLRSKGFEVACAVDGEEAMRLLRERPIDLVLLDLRMPKFDGVDVLAAIRSDPHLRNIPVLMMTAATTPLLEFHLRPSVQAWLVKASVGLSQLLDCIRTHSRGATFQPIQAPPTPPEAARKPMAHEPKRPMPAEPNL